MSWHGALHANTVAESLETCGFAIRSQIIWAKERLVLSRGDYHWQSPGVVISGILVFDRPQKAGAVSSKRAAAGQHRRLVREASTGKCRLGGAADARTG